MMMTVVQTELSTYLGIHPTIQINLMRVLNNPFKPIHWLSIMHSRPTITARQKLDLLSQKREEIYRQILAVEPNNPYFRAKDIVFLIATTMTFELFHPDRQLAVSGLVTTFVGQDGNWLTTGLKRQLFESYFGEEVELSNRAIERCCKFGAETSVNLQTIGLNEGSVGPWTIPEAEIERVFIDRIYLHDDSWHGGDPIPVVDYAFDSMNSFLVLDCQIAKKIPDYYASLTHMRPVKYIRVKEPILTRRSERDVQS
jgi:hypothetical protein